jgi:voltage-gated potassium channel
LRGAIRRHFMPHRHSALLAAIIAAFATRPLIGNNRATLIIFSLMILALLVLGLYTIQVDELVGEERKLVAERRRRNIIGWILAAAATAERLTMFFSSNHQLGIIGSGSWLLFFAFITWHELRAVLRQREVTSETICMSISVYLLIGLTWAFLYTLIYQIEPHAFSFPGTDVVTANVPTEKQESVVLVLVYFSLVTLTTIGYGDISPLTMKARYAAIAEGVTGQFYLAILVARLVGMQMSRSMSQQTGNPPQRSGQDSAPGPDAANPPEESG